MASPSEGDTPVTEKICELKRKDVGTMAKSLELFREDFRLFKDGDFHDLKESVTEVVTQYSDVCNDVGNLGEWKTAHEKSHTTSRKLLSLFLQGGSWILAIITLVLLFLYQTGVIGGGKP